MALQPCRECAKAISTEALTCPNCGAPNPTTVPLTAATEPPSLAAPAPSPERITFEPTRPPEKTRSRAKGCLYFILIVFGLFVLLVVAVGLTHDPKTQPVAASTPTKPSITTSASKAPEPQPPALAAAPAAQPKAPDAEPQPDTASGNEMTPSRSGPAPIAESATTPITTEDSPKLFKQWGSKGFKRINAAYAGVAKIASLSSRCDEVWMTGYSFDQSKPPKSIVVFADCKNGERFYATEQQASLGAPLPSEQERNLVVSESAALFACRDAVQAKLEYPSSMDAHMIMGSATERMQFGEVSVYLEFEAKNGLGNMLPYRAWCIAGADSIAITSIKSR